MATIFAGLTREQARTLIKKCGGRMRGRVGDPDDIIFEWKSLTQFVEACIANQNKEQQDEPPAEA